MNVWRIWIGCLCVCVWTVRMEAQRFRMAGSRDRYTDGCRYLIGTVLADGKAKVMGEQKTLSTAFGSRKTVELQASEDGTLTVHGISAACFSIEFLNGRGPAGRFRLRDEATGGLLCYDRKGSSSASSVPLYTLAEADVSGTLCADFLFDFTDPKKRVATAETIKYSDKNSRSYYLYADRAGSGFRLYAKPGTQTNITFYYEVQPPALRRDTATCVTTFYGEWTAGQLEALDWRNMPVVDFTQADIAGPWEAECHSALTYVTEQQRSFLPREWRNVVQLKETLPDGTPLGEAVTPVGWTDRDTIWVKYAFRVPEDGTLRYERTVVSDGGYHSVYLPFAVTRFTVEGEVPTEWTVFVPERCAETGIILVAADEGTVMSAYCPYLLRGTASGKPVRLLFEGGAQTIAATVREESGTGGDTFRLGGTLTGERPLEGRGCYGLDDSGSCFVRLEGNGHIRPFRVCLYRSGNAGSRQLPLIGGGTETGIPDRPLGKTVKRSGMYRLNGMPAAAPGRFNAVHGRAHGIYILDGRKLFFP